MENLNFTELPISDLIKKAICDMGYEKPTPIQLKSIPLILDGKDIIGHSQTGTGKTAAFGIPALEKIDYSNKNKTQVLILCPTRELAIQACDEIKKFGKYLKNARVIPIFGGQPIEKQINALRQGAEIVIGTPGRIIDHMKRKTLNLDNLSMIVLDEADEMLNMGFRDDIEIILNDTPSDRQTVLFSATMSKEIMQITKNYLNNPEVIKVVRNQMTLSSTSQNYYQVPKGRKIDVLTRLLDYYIPSSCMVFCNTKKMVDELVVNLQNKGYKVEGLHGDMKQTARTQVMNSFKRSKIDILVATDVAARGIDVDDLEIVFNYDIPQDLEYYVHRIGRTGRAGKQGQACSLVENKREFFNLKNIEKITRAKIIKKPIPSFKEVQQIKINKNVDKIKSALLKEDLNKNIDIIDMLVKEGYTENSISCALLNLLLSDNISPVEIEFEKFSEKANRKPKIFSKGKENTEKIMFNVGKKNKIMPNHILGAIVGETEISAKSIGQIDIRENYTVVDVPKKDAQFILDKMKNVRIKGIKSKCDFMSKTPKNINKKIV